MVAGVGFEPHDLRVMSPTSYQAALPRDILNAKKGIGAGDRSRTGTMLSHHGILSPGRLPIPPHRQMVQTSIGLSTTPILYHRIGWMSIVNIEKIVFGGFFDRHSSPAQRNEMLSRMAGDGAMTQ